MIGITVTAGAAGRGVPRRKCRRVPGRLSANWASPRARGPRLGTLNVTTPSAPAVIRREVSVNETTKPEAPTSSAELTIVVLPGLVSWPTATPRRTVKGIVLALFRLLQPG